MRNERIVSQIEKMLGRGSACHAFLFCGGSPESREEIGMWLSERVLCSDELSRRKFLHGNHEDFIVLDKPADRESIVKEQILDLLERIEYKPYGDRYAVLIRNAHLMNEISQNKLLKGLEEPGSQVVYILLAEREDALLPTVRSRCASFHLEEEKTETDGRIAETAEAFAKEIGSRKNYYRKKALLSGILSEKEEQRKLAVNFLDVLEDRLEEGMLKGDMDKARAIEHLETARKYLAQGQSVAYTLKQFCLRV